MGTRDRFGAVSARPSGEPVNHDGAFAARGSDTGRTSGSAVRFRGVGAVLVDAVVADPVDADPVDADPVTRSGCGRGSGSLDAAGRNSLRGDPRAPSAEYACVDTSGDPSKSGDAKYAVSGCATSEYAVASGGSGSFSGS